MNAQAQRAMSLLIFSINALLTAENRPFRVTADDIIVTRRGGVTFIALRETRDAADWRDCAQPYSTMEKCEPDGKGTNSIKRPDGS